MQVHTKDGQELQEVMEVMVLQCFLRATVFSACYSVSWEEIGYFMRATVFSTSYSVPWEETGHAYVHEQKQAVEFKQQ